MRFKNLVLLALLLALALPLVSGCDSFLDVNDDPNSATQVKPDPLFVAATAAMGANRTIELQPTTYHAQTWASDGVQPVFNDPEQYIISPFTTGNTWVGKYVDQNENLQLLINQELNSEVPDFNAILQAKTLQMQNYYDLTVLFGAIPFQQANDLDIDKPDFDDQETVLNGIVARLDTAITQATVGTSDPDLSGVQNGDLIYNGDIEKWVRYANSLRLKSLMLLRSGGADVDGQISSLIDSADLIESNDADALIPFSDAAGNENPRFQLLQDFGGGQPNFVFGGEALISLMNDKDDPRLPTYFSTNSQGEYAGSPPGALGGDYSVPSSNILRSGYPARLTTAGEVLLLEAEFLLDDGDTGEASDKYEAGIRASMDFFDERPGAIDDADVDSYIDSLPDLSSMSQDDAIQAVQEQQYIDIFERSIDAWTTQRRTGVPELEVPQGAVLGDIIQRYDYPPDPKASNPNTPSSVPLTTPLFFAQ